MPNIIAFAIYSPLLKLFTLRAIVIAVTVSSRQFLDVTRYVRFIDDNGTERQGDEIGGTKTARVITGTSVYACVFEGQDGLCEYMYARVCSRADTTRSRATRRRVRGTPTSVMFVCCCHVGRCGAGEFWSFSSGTKRSLSTSCLTAKTDKKSVKSFASQNG